MAALSFILAGSSCAEDGLVKVRIVDAAGNKTAARAWIDAGEQRLFKPTAPDTATPYAKDRSFSCDGEFVMAVPEGRATIHVEKGKEFVPVDVEIQVAGGETLERTIELNRWINMPSRGWFSADLHLHLGHDDPRVLQQLALADDVHLVPSFTYWLRGEGEKWNARWPAGEFNRPIRIDDHHLVTRNNIEIERIKRTATPGGTIGATFLFNLKQPVTADRYGFAFPTDAELCRVARRHSPDCVLDSDKPSWSETVIGAALGQLDTIQVCNNHYHRLNTIRGGWGMIGPLETGESNEAVGDALFHRTNSLYYRFLNCGFRLGVSGGSAIGVMPLPAGYNRTYARIDGEITAKKMWASIKAGRTFATSGPMLSLTANGQPIGSTVSVKSSDTKTIKVAAHVESMEKLEALQLVHNGTVVSSSNLLNTPGPGVDPLKFELKFDLKPKQSGWIAARAIYRAPDGLLRQAHTSPIYISVDEKPVAFADDARYMLRWIDQLTAIANERGRFPTDDARREVLETYAEARLKYEEVITHSIRIMKWNDLLSRQKPEPDATIAYGKHPLQIIDVWKPAGKDVTPAVIMIHGGCWQTGIAERDIMNWIADDLRSHGVGVWNIEYRGVDRDGGFPSTFEDVGKAADLFREKAGEYGFANGKLVAIGHSAGGHLALWLANRPALPQSEPIRGERPIEIDLAISQGGLPDLRAGANRDGHACGTDAPLQMMGADRRVTQITSPPEMPPGKARQVLFNNTLDRIAPPEYAHAYIANIRQQIVAVSLVETEAEGHVELIAPDSRSWAKQRALILRELGLTH